MILAVIFLFSCNGIGAGSDRKRFPRSELAKYGLNSTDINVFSNKPEAACIVSGGLTGITSNDDKEEQEEQCTYLVYFGYGYTPCMECAVGCIMVYGFEYSCCDGNFCCCYLEPGPCQRSGVSCIENCCA